MNSTRYTVLCLAVGMIAGLLLSSLLSGTGALAQPGDRAEPPGPAPAERPPQIERPARPPGPAPMVRGPMGMMPRYQVSAYGMSNSMGCYITDPPTGETWLITGVQPPHKVAEKLAP